VIEDEEQTYKESLDAPNNKIEMMPVDTSGKNKPLLNTVDAKPEVVSRPAQPIMINEKLDEELERPQTAKSQATNVGNF